MSLFTDHLLVFLHLPKCAGTTLDRVAKATFGRERFHYFRATRVAGRRVEDIPADRIRNVRWLSGHFGYGDPLLGRFEKKPLFITSVRDPVERIRSYYAYQVKKSVDRPNPVNERLAQISFVDFCQELLDRDLPLSRNNQCEMLGLPSSFDEARVIARDRFLVMASTAGVIGAGAMIQKHFGDGSPAETHRNRSPSEHLEIPPEIEKAIAARTRLDSDLVKWVMDVENEWLDAADAQILAIQDKAPSRKSRMNSAKANRDVPAPFREEPKSAVSSRVVGTSPYEGLPPSAFWRTGVSEQTVATVQGLYRKRFEIDREMRIATAGSCFAQHIARNMRQRGYSVIDAEPPPSGLSTVEAQSFGFNLYSARYGNIYTTRQLLQLHAEAYGAFTPADAIWENDGRYFDALRPSVEPRGLPSPGIVRRHRADHLTRVRQVFETADVFVYTFGLTEAWVHTASGTVYPTAPGTIAGIFDPSRHSFVNFGFNDIYGDFIRFRARIKKRRPDMKFLLTVSPVPLTATASSEHVLAATTYSKSVLRAVAGEVYKEFDDVDYFPSYEIIASPFSRGALYEANLRSVRDRGVRAVMSIFFEEHDGAVARGRRDARPTQALRPIDAENAGEDVVCEEALLEAFNR